MDIYAMHIKIMSGLKAAITGSTVSLNTSKYESSSVWALMAH